MRLLEIASAEEQMALWKLVSDNVWKAIAQQAEQEAAENAERARQAKLKPKTKASPPPPDPIPALPPPPLPKPKPLYTNKPKVTVTQPRSMAVRSSAPKSVQNSQTGTSKDLTQGIDRQA